MESLRWLLNTQAFRFIVISLLRILITLGIVLFIGLEPGFSQTLVLTDFVESVNALSVAIHGTGN